MEKSEETRDGFCWQHLAMIFVVTVTLAGVVFYYFDTLEPCSMTQDGDNPLLCLEYEEPDPYYSAIEVYPELRILHDDD